MTELSIPVIDVAALFGGASGARGRTDEALMAAATTFGFFTAGGLPADVPIDRESRADLLRVVQLGVQRRSITRSNAAGRTPAG